MGRFATTRREAVGLRATGVLFLLVLAGLVWLSIAIYAKTFSDHVTVAVDAERTGLQLNVGSDVRMNGAIVGRVSSVEPDGRRGRIELQIDGDKADQIPSDVTARIVPTTLFGQKFVELASGADPASGHLVEGARIAQDTSAEAAEVTDVLDRLEPVISAVRPQRLAATLSALGAGLDGNGARLGRLVDQSGAYLAELNTEVPAIERDLRLLDAVAGQYADVAPDLLAAARDVSVTSRTVAGHAGELDDLIGSVRTAADSADALLRENQENLVEAARIARPTLELLAQYSPQIPCMLDGFLVVRDQSAAQVRGGSIHGDFGFGAQLPGYGEDDQLELNMLGAGPACHGLPNAQIPFPDYTLDEGYTRPAPNDLPQILLGPDLFHPGGAP